MRRLVIFISLLLILASFSPTNQPTKTITETKNTQTIALIYKKYLYFVDVKLNGRNARLLVDTGAAASLLDINQAKNYKFKYHKTTLVFTGLGGEKSRYNLSNYQFHHDSTSLKVHPQGVDLSHVVESFSANGVDIAGVLGSDFLRSSNAIIDYKNQKLIISN